MSGSGRVKSEKAAEEAKKPSAQKPVQIAKEAPPEADEDEGEEETPAAEDAEGDEDLGSDEGDQNEEEEDDGENEPVTGLSTDEVAAGQRKAAKRRPVPKVPEIPDGHEAVLSSPRDFGIWIDGKLHRFQKGRTRLTDEQHNACHTDSYVRDNGASVSYRPVKAKSKK